MLPPKSKQMDTLQSGDRLVKSNLLLIPVLVINDIENKNYVKEILLFELDVLQCDQYKNICFH